MNTKRFRWIVGGAALACLCFASVLDLRATLAAYLVGWITIASVPIGALIILSTTYLVRRSWTEDLHDILVATTATLPLCGLLFVPVLLGQSLLYPVAAGTGAPALKAAYLAPWPFALRTIACFLIWSVLAAWLAASRHDHARASRAAAVSLIVTSLTVSLVSIDWLESLSPDFHSSIYGLLFVSYTLMSSLAFVSGVGLLSPKHIRSTRGYGALLLSVILLWAYLHAMQYIVIWAGNIPDEVTWYLARKQDGWQYAVLVLAFGQFVVPFFLLLSARVRRDRRWLVGLCAATLTMRAVEAAVLALPELDGFSSLLLCFGLVAALLFVGCVFAAGVSYRLGRASRHVSATIAPART